MFTGFPVSILLYIGEAELMSLVFTTFTTAWGPMGAVADDGELVRVVLPHYQRDDLRALLAFEHQDVAEDESAFSDLIERCRAYFNGQPVSFDAISCRLPSEKAFGGKVLRMCREVPFGETMSYSQLAREIGREDAARAVAGALGKNAIPLVIPCHRVTYADGTPGGFSAEGGVAMKQRMLAMEASSR
jgi:methylated-DNA-[protein]-cysteine S-methyltransferase